MKGVCNMKMFILTITYNFEKDSVVIKCDSYEDAVERLNNFLDKEVQTIKTENNYIPSTLKWSEDDVTLVYAEGYTTETIDRNNATENCAYYKVFELKI